LVQQRVQLAVYGADGSQAGGRNRLITTLTGWQRCPAAELIRLYHERWEIEVAYLALRHTLLGGTCSAPGTGPAPSRNYGRC
jgi:hypothetical protein